MNSLLTRFDKLFLRKLEKFNFFSSRVISKISNSNLQFRKITYSRHYPCARSFQYRKQSSCNAHFLYAFTAAFSLTKLYEAVGLGENKEVKKLIQKAKQHLEDGKVDEAHVVFNEALQTAINTQDHEDVYFIKEQLATIAFFLKKYEDAEKLFVEVQNYFTGRGMHLDDLKVAYVNLKLAELYDFMKNDTKAQEFYKLCSRGLKKKITDALEHKDQEVIQLWIMSLSSRAHFFLNHGNFDKAYKYFKKAHEASVHIQGELSEQAVMFLQQVGAVCFQKGDLESAVDYLKRAIELGKHLPGMVQLSNAHITLGNIYIKQGFFKDAFALCTEGHKNAARHEYEQGVKEASACLDELKRTSSKSYE